MLLNNSTKKIGAVFCATVMLLLIAQTVISNDNQKPIAIAGNDVFVDIGVTVDFDGSQSYDPDSNLSGEYNNTEPEPLNYTWNLQDGMDYGSTTYHAFDTAGVYLVILMVRDSRGDVGFDTLNVTVRNTPPVAFAEVNETAYEDEMLVFNGTQSSDNSTDISSLEYYWNFGDGTVSNESVVNHTYIRSGTYI
ncbi:MAG: PKD domain-containing protein, partial [Thermoplasmata archaeon]|nr:PKD domain-containing protein [Thermoplasmata archaeon]